MKKHLLSTALMMILPLSVMAAEAPNAATAAHPKMGNKGEWLTKDLGLSAEQQTKVEAIFEQNRQKSKVLHDEMSAEIKAVLTPEQFAKMKEKHEKMRDAHENKGSARE
jgi:Spy/CpxP family protein refolding chaperone